MVYQWAGKDWLEPMYGIRYNGFAYNICRVFPSPLIQVIRIKPICQAHSDWWEEQLHHIARSIRSGIFPARPDEGNCANCWNKQACKPPKYRVFVENHGTDIFAED